MRIQRALLALAWLGFVLASCTNNPYPDEDAVRKIIYTSFNEAPKTLDPAVAYTTSAHAFTGIIYDTLLEYHYLKRPYTLIPAQAEAVPEARRLADGRVAYLFSLRPDLLYQDDPCFEAVGEGGPTRQIVTADIAFALHRIADPAVNSPVEEPLSNIDGLRDFAKRLALRRESDPEFAALPVHVQYEEVGPVRGIRVLNERSLEIVLRSAYPQILYWFAMAFTAPIPWEAVAYYDGEAGRPHLADHPVGSGPYRIVEYDKQARIVLEVNPNWYGIRHPEWNAPGAVYPSEGEQRDHEAGRLSEDVVGRSLPRIERLEYRREKEAIPRFSKFLQGYYDASGIIRESFDKVILEDGLSPEMEELGIQLEKSVIPAVYYIGFNMDDPVVGKPGAQRAAGERSQRGTAGGERSRKLRQAMSMVIDTKEYTRLFMNGRGVPAQSPLPPGIFGYDPEYENPYRKVDLERARELLASAGYPGGVDPATGKPLRLTFDSYDTSAQGLLRFQFYVNAWRQIGIDVQIVATNYNQFQEKMRNGAYQVFQWGWVADYPDAENFFFLLTTDMMRSKGGPNSANFSNAEFDRLFLEMKARPNDERRAELIVALRDILERERPWIELMHPEDYALYHSWFQQVKPFGMSYPMVKYRDLDPAERARSREQWNEPVLWPAYALAGASVAIIIPGIVTFFRERQ